MKLGVIGTSIWQQNLRLLQRMTIDPESRETRLKDLKTALGVDELIYLATCNRIEILYAISDESQSGRILHRLIDFFFKNSKDISFFPNDFYHYQGKEAISHLFRTVSSLESLVIGETQITGQFKQAFNDCRDFGLTGITLEHLAQQALVVAKKVKGQTTIGQGSLSMASLAGDALQSKLENIEDPTIALIGAGPMTTKLAKYILASTKGNLLFVNRTVEKVEGLTKQFGGTAISLEQFLSNPIKVDAIVSATSASGPVFTHEFIENCGDKIPKVCIDLAIPRDFSIDFDDHPEINLIDIPQLKSFHQGNLREKFIEAGKANEIVRNEVNNYLSNRIETSLRPIFNESYRETVNLANDALNKLFDKKLSNLDEDQQEAISRLVNKLIGHSSFNSIKMLSEFIVETRGEIKPDSITVPQKQSA